MKKKIEISFNRTNFQNYWNWFTKEDLLDKIELVELSFEENNVEVISQCDGFILTGGVDINPSFYRRISCYGNQPPGNFSQQAIQRKIYSRSNK